MKITKLLAFILLLFWTIPTFGQSYDNAYVNSCDPNTIEYDNMVSGFHTTIIKTGTNSFSTWGQWAKGMSHLASPTPILPPTFNYTGTPLKATLGTISFGDTDMFLLTTDGLYIWGRYSTMNKLTVDGETDGLPPGVSPTDVKMLFGSMGLLAIVTNNGETWVMGRPTGDGYEGSYNYKSLWTRVKKDATTTLDNVVAVRGVDNVLFALTSDGKLYTWGRDTLIGNNSLPTVRHYATEVSVPAGVTPKMIGMTTDRFIPTYYLLATNGKLYVMGGNMHGQLGTGDVSYRYTWVQPIKHSSQGQGTGYLEDVVWISPNEHDSTTHPAINVITKDKKLWTFGSNDRSMTGAGGSIEPYPKYMPGRYFGPNDPNYLNLSDNILMVETGGHTSMNMKEGSNKLGYIGHRVNGSMGDGTIADYAGISTYTYNATPGITVLGVLPSGEVTSTTTDTTLCAGSPITFALTTENVVQIGIPTGLPPGITVSYSNDVITFSGTPTVPGTYNYSIPLNNTCTLAKGVIEVGACCNANAGTLTKQP